MQIIKEEDQSAISLAIDSLQKGKIIAFASDTIYGLAVDATNSKAVEALYEIKKRDSKKPIAIFVKNLKKAEEIFIFDEQSKRIAKKFFPGNLTLVLKTKINNPAKLAPNLNKSHDGFLGFRIIDSEFTNNLFKKFDGILAVSSANFSNQEPAFDAKKVEEYFFNSDILLIDGGVSKNKIPSTVIKFINNKIEIIRSGLISETELRF